MMDVQLIEQTSNFFRSILEVLPNIALVLAVAIGSLLVFIMIIKALNFYRLLKEKTVLLEITPPASNDKTPEATQRLFAVLHGMATARSWQDKLLRRKLVLSLELVSSKAEGIRYVLRMAERDLNTVRQHITSYLSGVKLQLIDEYLPPQLQGAKVVGFKQQGHFAFPLQSQNASDQHDPIAYLAGQMATLAADEQIVFQVLISPTAVREADIISKKVLSNEDLLSYLNGGNKATGARKVFGVINTLLFGVVDAISSIGSAPSKQGHHLSHSDAREKQQIAMRIKPARTLSTFEQELLESVHDKVRQPLFRAEIRALVLTKDKGEAKRRIKGIQESLAVFKVPKYQSLHKRRTLPITLKCRLLAFRHRLPSFFAKNSSLLSTSEVADLYHFPTSGSTAESVVKSHSRTLPAPLSLKQQENFDVVLGRNKHQGRITDIGLATAERVRHMYIVGGTGNGKTTLLLYAIIQDIRAGKSVAVIDPHGDLAEALLRYIPKERLDDVVYFNPYDIDYPIGLNPLETDPKATGSEKIKLKNRTTEVVVEALRKVFSDDGTGGHRIEYVLRNALLTAMTVKGATLFTILKLLRNSAYRKSVVDKLEDENLKDFWNEELGKAGDYQRVKMAHGVTTKIDRFQSDPIVERVMGQEKSTINFDEILDGKIFIANLAKGKIGPDTSDLLGTVILSQLQLAAERRILKKESERKPFYLYVDEFQNFATNGFAEMVAEARKYGLSLTMAEQTTSQQDDSHIIGTILANVGTIICFRTGNPADEQLLLPFFGRFLEAGEINSLPAFNFYARLSSLNSQEPVSGETIVLEDKGSEEIAERAIAASQANYGKKYEPVTHPKDAGDDKKPKGTGNVNPTVEPN